MAIVNQQEIKMEPNEVSLHQCKVFLAVKNAPMWITANEIAELANVAPRTARSHALKLVNLGIFDQAEVFPAHRYRLSDKAAKRNKAYLQRIEGAISIFNF
jgi:DNA-binding IclR family transcriptional regulator